MTTLGMIIRELRLTEVLSVQSDDYDWDGFTAWRTPRGRFYWFADSGCSCTSFGEGIGSASELSDGTRADMERAFREWAKTAREIDHVDVIDTIARMRQVR
jgi:hypothetical protein